MGTMKSPLASGAVYVTSRYATRPGARYKGYEQRAIALLELILIEVVYGMHLNPRMEPQSLLLALHSEDLKMAPDLELAFLGLRLGLASSCSPCLFETLGPCPWPGLDSPWLSTFNLAG